MNNAITMEFFHKCRTIVLGKRSKVYHQAIPTQYKDGRFRETRCGLYTSFRAVDSGEETVHLSEPEGKRLCGNCARARIQ